jgi:hypothetical protein
MNINEILVKVSSRIAIDPQELELGQDISLLVKGTIVKKEIMDNQEGSVDICYIIKPQNVQVQ